MFKKVLERKNYFIFHFVYRVLHDILIITRMEFVNLPNENRKLIFESYICVKPVVEFHGSARRDVIKNLAKQKLKRITTYSKEGPRCISCNLPNPEEVEILKARNAMQLQAETTEDSTQNRIGTNVQQLSEAARARMPNLETTCRRIRRVREDDVRISPQPADRNFVIPPV